MSSGYSLDVEFNSASNELSQNLVYMLAIKWESKSTIKFQFKMGLQKITQIPRHHVLANQNALKFKKGEPLKQLFNINLGIVIIKKLLFLFVFSTYIPVFLLKFRSRELVGCRI